MMRVVLVAAVLAVVLSAVASPVAAAGLSTGEGTESLNNQLTASQSDDTNATETPTPTPASSSSETPPSDGRPSTADTVRVLPVQFEPEYLSVDTAQQGARYNTSGPFAVFSFSEPVDQVAIQQPKATATVLEGGRQVRVSYEPDAAPVGSQSLYELQVYFADGSSRTIELYAERTSVDVGSAEMKKYRPFILDVLEDAEEAGYDRSPEGAESHYEDVQETAQLLDSLFVEQAVRLLGSLFGIVSNPLGIASILVGAAIVTYWMLSRNRSMLELLTNDSGKSARKRQELWLKYKQAQQTAAEEPLSELKGVGEMGEIYWRDAFGVDTVAGLAELFRQGFPVRRDGETKHVGGVDSLDVETIDASWLEAVCRDHRLPSVEIALAHGKLALRRMVSEYGMGHVYEETLQDVRELIEELDESRDISRYAAEDMSGAPAPGDD